MIVLAVTSTPLSYSSVRRFVMWVEHRLFIGRKLLTRPVQCDRELRAAVEMTNGPLYRGRSPC